MRRLAKEQRRAARRTQQQPQGKAVEISAAPIKEQAVVAVKAEEQAIDRKKAGRRATVATNHIFCPTEGCRGYGHLGPHPNHRIVGCGTYTTQWGQRRQMFKCMWCGQRFSETQGTVFFGLKTKDEVVYRAITALAEGVGIRSTARIFGVEVEDHPAVAEAGW